jgi:DNA-binding CsgD family transcriptional regulator
LKRPAPAVDSLLAKHYAPKQAPTAARINPDDLEAAFSSFKPGALSPREQRIASLALRGHASGSVSRVLGIAEGTVKNHRKRIYSKLGVSSQGERFNLFLGHVLRA